MEKISLPSALLKKAEGKIITVSAEEA